MSTAFSDSYTLVTGASSGLGAEFAHQLGARGSHLVLTGRSRPRLEAVADDVADTHGVTAHVFAEDLAAADGARALCDQLDATGLHIDHVINNAGFGSFGRFADAAPEDAAMVRVNCEAPMVLARHFLPAMVDARRGGIVFVASFAGLNPIPYMAAYSASKAFVVHMSLAIGEEVRGAGVRVMALCPNAVPTGFQQRARYRLGAVDRAVALSARQVVRKALDDYERGARVCLPGTATRAMAAAMRVLPTSATTGALGHMLAARLPPRGRSR